MFAKYIKKHIHKQQRGRDSNPRFRDNGIHTFQACAFDHSATSLIGCKYRKKNTLKKFTTQTSFLRFP